MDLDRRADQAARGLRDHVDRRVDLDHARACLDATGTRRTREARTARVAVAALVVVAGALGFAVVRNGGIASVGGTSDREVSSGRHDSQADREILEQLPSSPIDGKASWRLPVLADPQSGVRDGQSIKVYGRGFENDEQVGIVFCASEADTANSGIGACDLGTNGSFDHVQYATADGDGTILATVTVRRHITTPDQGEVDCAAAAERCLVGMGAISNYDRSGGSYLQFDGAPDFPTPTLTVIPDGGLTAGQTVDVAVTDWAPSRQIRFQQCQGVVCQNLLDGAATTEGTFAAQLVLNDEIVVDGVANPCGGTCVLRATGIGLRGQSGQPFPEDHPLTFVLPADGQEASTTTAAPSTAAPSTTAPPTTAAPTTAPATPATEPTASTTSSTTG